MRIIFSIFINASILYIMAYLLGPSDILGLGEGISVSGGWQTYILGGVIIGLLNMTIKPILTILSLPLFFVFLGLIIFIVNAIILKLFDHIINLLQVPGVTYNINGLTNFVIAVAIFTILNMFYSLLPYKK